MAIQKFKSDLAGQTAAFAVAQPRTIELVDGVFIVKTGSDYDSSQTLVPQLVSRMQAMVAMQQAGILTQIQTYINSSTDPILQIYWNNAQEFSRSSPTIAKLAVALNMTQVQLDNLFIAAAKVQA